MEIWEIQPGLFQSSKIHGDSFWKIRKNEIDFILDLEGGFDPNWVHFLVDEYIYWHILDLPFLPNPHDLWEYAGIAYRMWKRERIVLIHCRKGRNRSSLLNGCILHLDGMSGVDAIEVIRAKVPDALSNLVFKSYLEELRGGYKG